MIPVKETAGRGYRCAMGSSNVTERSEPPRIQLDAILIMATVALSVMGALSVYAATRNHLIMMGRPSNAYLTRDLLNFAVGAALSVPIFFVDYRQLRLITPLAYVTMLGLLALVLTPLGQRINGAHAWFSFGPVQLEPSEFSKLVVIILLAGLLSERQDKETAPHFRVIMLSLALAGVPTLFILAEPALGIAIVLAAISLTLIALSGAQARLVVTMLLAAVFAAILASSLHFIKPYQQERFTAFANPAAAQHSTTGYQIRQSNIAIGSGGLLGQGFLQGSQTDGGFVPEQQTDFVFTVAAEEGGLVGGCTILAALAALLWRGIKIAESAPDLYGRLIAGGVTMWLALQSFVNIGMTLGIMPVTGLPLPFVSYGGSALLADLIGVALLLSVHRQTLRSRPGARFSSASGPLSI